MIIRNFANCPFGRPTSIEGKKFVSLLVLSQFVSKKNKKLFKKLLTKYQPHGIMNYKINQRRTIT